MIGPRTDKMAGGGSSVDPELVARLLGRCRTADGIGALTPPEREVPALMAEGWSDASIACLRDAA